MLSLGALILQVTLVGSSEPVVLAFRQVGRRTTGWRFQGLDSVRVGGGWLAGGELDFATLHVRPGDMAEVEVRAGAYAKRLRFDVEPWERVARDLGPEWRRAAPRERRSVAKRGIFNRIWDVRVLANGGTSTACGGYDLIRHLRAILELQRKVNGRILPH